MIDPRLYVFMGISVLVAGWILWTIRDPLRVQAWRDRFGRVGAFFERGPVGRWFDRSLGLKMARKSLAEHLAGGNPERAIALAKQYGLVGEAVEIVTKSRGVEDAARFARACGDEALARSLFTRASHAFAAAGDHARAALAAEEGGLTREAAAEYGKVAGGGGDLRKAQLAEREHRWSEALEIFIRMGAVGDAFRVAEKGKLLRELVNAAEMRGDGALLRGAAEAAKLLGDRAKEVALYRRAGDLAAALTAARAGTLAQQEREILHLLKARNAPPPDAHVEAPRAPADSEPPPPMFSGGGGQ